MRKSMRNMLVGTGILAAGAVAFSAATRTTSRYMIRLALDREGPRKTEENISRVSGRGENIALAEKMAEAKLLLENACRETFAIQGHDGIRLVAHWRPCQEPRRILIAMHGWRSSWSRDFGLIADFWYRNGCSVLYPEQRGQGESGGECMGFGMLERHDCLQWARWVSENLAGELPVYLVGISMGAATVLMAGGMELPSNVHGIMADCGFTSAHDIWKHVAENNLHLHYGLYAAAADDLCKKKIRCGARDCSTVEALGECEVPVLFVHGTDDSFVPVEMTYENYKACAAPKRLLIVPGAEHGMSYCVAREEYEKAMTDFWEEFDG